MSKTRKRWLYFILIMLTIPLGLATRWCQQYFPHVIDVYGGDAFSATCIFWGIRFLYPTKPLHRVALISYIICVLIELQQLYQAPWAVAFRNNVIVGIFLGHGFLWSDLVCYAVGVVLGYLLALLFEWVFATKSPTPAAY